MPSAITQHSFPDIQEWRAVHLCVPASPAKCLSNSHGRIWFPISTRPEGLKYPYSCNGHRTYSQEFQAHRVVSGGKGRFCENCTGRGLDPFLHLHYEAVKYCLMVWCQSRINLLWNMRGEGCANHTELINQQMFRTNCAVCNLRHWPWSCRSSTSFIYQ